MADTIRVAAAGDIHCDPHDRERIDSAFDRVADRPTSSCSPAT